MNNSPPSQSRSETRLAEVLDDYLAAVQRGAAFDRSALLAAHPDLAEDLEGRILLSNWPVTTTADNNDNVNPVPGSLRQAIQNANNDDPGATITFELADDDPRHFYYRDNGVSGVVSSGLLVPTTTADDAEIADRDPDHRSSFWSILVSTPLPTITNSVTIDGYSQRGAVMNTSPTEMNAILTVNIYGLVGSGQAAHGPASAFTITADNSTISGLDIVNFGQGIQILGGDDNRIQGNIIGVDPSRFQPYIGIRQGNPFGANLLVTGGATHNVIGVDGDGQNELAERNFLVWGTLDIGGAGTDDNVVAGNVMQAYTINPSGIPLAGTMAVRIGGGARRARIGTNGDGISDLLERNVVGSVAITGAGTDENVVAGNYLGVEPNGINGGWVIGGSSAGPFVGSIQIADGASRNRIGVDGSHANAAAEGNVIAHSPVGVDITSSSNNRVSGNIIGLDASGTNPYLPFGGESYGHGIAGVRITSGNSNVIGTDGDGRRRGVRAQRHLQ